MAEKVVSKIQSPDASVYSVREETVIGKIISGGFPIVADSLFMFDVGGKAYPFVRSANTTTATGIPSSVQFPANAEIFTNLVLSADASITNIAVRKTGLVDIRYSSTNHNVALIPNDKFNKVYMPITLNADRGTFTLKSQNFVISGTTYTNNFTSSVFLKGSYYMFIGYNATSNISYNLILAENHPIYYYDGVTLIKQEIATPDLNNAVSGSGDNPMAGEDIFANTIVCMGYDGRIYPISSVAETVTINQDWGLAICTTDVSSGNNIPYNTLFQQIRRKLSELHDEFPTSGLTDGITFSAVFPNQIGPTLLPGGIIRSLNTLSMDDEYTYVYIGVITDGCNTLNIDLSNHDFIGIRGKSIAYINGRALYTDTSGGGGGGSYNNPVAPYGVMPTAGTTILTNSFVCRSTNGNLYPLTYKQSIVVDPDWGLALYTGGSTLTSGSRPDASVLLQQGSVNASINVVNGATSVAFDKKVYAQFLYNPNTHEINLCTEAPLASSQYFDVSRGLAKANTYVYVGVQNGQSWRINYDLSDHDFITVDDDSSIIALNGRPIASSGNDSSSSSTGYPDWRRVILVNDTNIASTDNGTVLFQLQLPAGTWAVTGVLTARTTSDVSNGVDLWLERTTVSGGSSEQVSSSHLPFASTSSVVNKKVGVGTKIFADTTNLSTTGIVQINSTYNAINMCARTYNAGSSASGTLVAAIADNNGRWNHVHTPATMLVAIRVKDQYND